jgi:hypothetical protein
MEIWKAIPDHDGYEVSNLGAVRSLDRYVTDRNGFSCFKKGRNLAVRLQPDAVRDCDRYAHCMLGRNRSRRVHQLVAWAFIGPQPAGQYVCHEDGDRSNNRVDNLYYGTPKQNQIDRHRHGKRGFGENHHNTTLTNEDVDKIRQRLKAGELQRVIAADYGLTQSAISNIKTGVRWAL